MLHNAHFHNKGGKLTFAALVRVFPQILESGPSQRELESMLISNTRFNGHNCAIASA